MNDTTNRARKFLESLQRFDLSLLLAHSEGTVQETTSEYQIEDDWFSKAIHDEVVVRAPSPIDQALRVLPSYDRKRIAEAIASGFPDMASPDDIRVETNGTDQVEGSAGVLAELLIHRAMMVSVATGGDRIQEVNDYYRAREVRIRQRLPDATVYNNPHEDLWDWYKYWSANLPQWRDRRHYVGQVFASAIAAISQRSSQTTPAPRAPTGWERVDRAMSKARNQLEVASAEEDCQAIGLLCREVTISLAQAVYDADLHGTLDGVPASKTDANRMLEAYIAHVFPGSSNKEVRAHARASLALALNLQHRRTATRQLAALCVEATASTTAVVSIIARPEARD